MQDRTPITPESKVATLLRDYPETEELLIGMAPAFKKLRNPVLRKSVARVASLRQAAAVGQLPVATLVNELRAAVGQEPLDLVDGDPVDYFGARPDWFDRSQIVSVVDEEDLDPDVMPINPLLREAKALRDRQIIEFVSAHLPAPGIDNLRGKGYLTWTLATGERIHTFVTKAKTSDPAPPSAE